MRNVDLLLQTLYLDLDYEILLNKICVCRMEESDTRKLTLLL